MFLSIKKKSVILMGALVLLGTQAAMANIRHFTYAYETNVLAPGERELELWSTLRTGRENFYSEFDHRAEFEFGLTKKLMTAFYMNWQTISQLDQTTTPESIQTQSEFKGISSEWKYKMTDSVANKIGSALYGEVSIGSDEMELEGKILLDKKLGKNLFAYNLVVDGEWEREPTQWDYHETGLENILAWSYLYKPHAGAGLELKNVSAFTAEHHPEYSALYLGPVFSYASDNWWVAFTSLWQLPAIKRSVNDPSSGLVLDDQEKFNARLLVSFRL